jgi:hypothetical protein
MVLPATTMRPRALTEKVKIVSTHFRPPQPHATVADMNRKSTRNGKIFFVGGSGHIAWMLCERSNPKPGESSHVLMIMESRHTRPATPAVTFDEALAVEAGR